MSPATRRRLLGGAGLVALPDARPSDGPLERAGEAVGEGLFEWLLHSFFGLFLGAILLLAPSAQATTLLQFTTSELVGRSPLVAVAEVQAKRFVRHGGRIVTEWTLGISEPIKGAQAGSEIVVEVPGGEDGEWVQRVEGAPQLREGDAVVVFLEPAGGGKFRFVGLEQGALKVLPDPQVEGGWSVVRMQDARLVRQQGGTLVPAPALPKKEPLGRYLGTLRQLAGARR